MAAAENGELNEQELSELDKLQLTINQKSDETLECTRRMREMCAEAKDSGMKTLIALDDQEELIDKFESAADGINQDMALAEKALKAMDMACFGLIPRFWVKDKGFKEDDAVWGDQKVVGAGPPPPATELRDGAFVATILCDAREEEMEENMEQVSAMIGNIRNMSNDMNTALVRQNQTLDRINAKAGSDITRVKMANERAAALMK
ncbi:synaptosomal-associated protein 25 [Eurytemora carolleeae]|uniref:synaptosomal-associated protein 25 n=1 Tax=Eurytemora carolleeae TaxID=1294199 RepID=UPI000C773E3D|nr:synaptosomal-associated protein 25 [Eurytemora carolleeae]|eukprot:XP_023327624.1 synaptosomal-associated protein 25-like [Eurytemora affinis]